MEWEAVALEEQIIQEQIINIQQQIDLYGSKISELQDKIEWNNVAIENNKSIQSCNERITELQR